VLRSCMRDGDLAARYGGEEFAVLLTGADDAGALAVAERIRGRTESTLISLAPGVTERLTVSIGMALAPDQAIERLTLLRLADEALYDAKQAGRNRVSYLGRSKATSGLASGRGGSAGQLGGKSVSPARDPEALPA
jgi:diguanylate cyclase (GGDEF)-like protein